MVAASNGFIDVVKILLNAGADVNAKKRDDHMTALLGAVLSGQISIAESLIAAGADVNAANNSGATPLILAAAHPDGATMVRLLLNAGADTNATAGTNNMTALGIAKVGLAEDSGFEEIVKLLLDAGAKE